ncbi:hypothetical protein T439DRAFT_46010 [Meredithblackwellia eburnea MCA 4105]
MLRTNRHIRARQALRSSVFFPTARSPLLLNSHQSKSSEDETSDSDMQILFNPGNSNDHRGHHPTDQTPAASDNNSEVNLNGTYRLSFCQDFSFLSSLYPSN